MSQNFYDNKRYKKLSKELEKYNLDHELLMVVGDAIQHGISMLEKQLEKRGGSQ